MRRNERGSVMIAVLCVMALAAMMSLALLHSAAMVSKRFGRRNQREQCRITAASVTECLIRALEEMEYTAEEDTCEEENDRHIDLENDLAVDLENDLAFDLEDDLAFDSENDLTVDSENELAFDSENDLAFDLEDDLAFDSENELAFDLENDLAFDLENDLAADLENGQKSDLKNNYRNIFEAIVAEELSKSESYQGIKTASGSEWESERERPMGKWIPQTKFLELLEDAAAGGGEKLVLRLGENSGLPGMTEVTLALKMEENAIPLIEENVLFPEDTVLDMTVTSSMGYDSYTIVSRFRFEEKKEAERGEDDGEETRMENEKEYGAEFEYGTERSEGSRRAGHWKYQGRGMDAG